MAEEKIGKVMDFFAKVGVAGILLEGTLKIGDTIHIKGHTTDLTITVDSLQIDRVPVPEAGKDKTIGIKITDRVRPGDMVYLVKP
jgi:translation initiation factor IF-2